VVLLGIGIGVFAVGLAGDKFGRRPVIIITSTFTGLFGLASAFSPNITTLLILRFLTGFMIGGSMLSFTLMSEFVPTRRRGIILMLFNLFWTFGGIGGDGVPV
jgi:putative MFS transporter